MLNFAWEGAMLRELVENQISIYQELIDGDYFHTVQKEIAIQRCVFLESILDQIEEFETKLQAIIDENEQNM
jgi:hypothetical protein